MDRLNRMVIQGCEFVILETGRLFPVLKGGDDNGPAVPQQDPGITRRQNELMDMQLDNARRSRMLEPILLEEAGLRYNDKTKSYEALDPSLAKNKKEIERLQTERSLKALKGELPISKTLIREFELGQQQLDEKLNRQGGPGTKSSTSGVMQQEAFDRNRIALQEAEQRDMLTTAEALALNRGASKSVTASQFENPFAAQARMYSPAQQSVADARSGDQFTRNMVYESNKQGQQNLGGYISGGMGAGAMLGGMMLMSDPEMKEDIEPVSDAALLASIRRVPVYKWKYKGDRSKKEHIGGMATDFPEHVSDGKRLDVVSFFGLLTGAVRELDRKVRDMADEEEHLSPAMALAF